MRIRKKEEMLKCSHGLYRINWSADVGGGSSLASIGSMHNGDRWMAPTTWTSDGELPPIGLLKDNLESISSIDLIETKKESKPRFLVFQPWHSYDGGGMEVYKFDTEQALAEWVMRNQDDPFFDQVWIIKGGKKIKPTVRTKKVVDTYEFEEVISYD